uniref:Uncharacterized protein n=1 Tax=viral metagenome TaxID=1070528 RepID=A0A6C0I672_9ZZZZ
MAAAGEAKIDHYIAEYYSPAAPRIRLVPPRTEAQLLTRSTCKEQFPTDVMIDQILYRPDKLPQSYMYFRRLLIRRILPGSEWMVYNETLPLEKRLIIHAIESEIPVLGTANILITPRSSHEIAFLMRCVKRAGAESRIEVFLFETYDTSTSHFGGSVEWKKAIGLYFNTIYNDYEFNPVLSLNLVETPAISVVLYAGGPPPPPAAAAAPPGVNLQEGEGKLGFCIMWSLIFLSYLRDMPDLRTATLAHFIQIYNDIIANKSTKDGKANLMGRVYGAARRKTQKNRVRSSHNVRRKTIRKSISSVRRRIRSGLKHRRRRV